MKHISNSPTGNKLYNKNAKAQLQGYVDSFNKAKVKAIKGETWNPNGLELPHPTNPNIEHGGVFVVKKLKAIIVKLASSKLQQYGFHYNEEESASGLWTFTRTIGNRTEFIHFDKSEHSPNSLRVNLRTTDNFKGVHGSQLAQKATQEWWTYKDDETLEQVVRELIELVIDKGLPWFSKTAKPIPKASEEMRLKLFHEREMLSLDFSNKYKLDYQDETVLKKIEDILRARETEVGEADWECILGAAAFYGELVRINLGATWFWKEETSVAILRNVGGKTNLNENPLAVIIRFWWNSYEKIHDRYRFLQVSI